MRAYRTVRRSRHLRAAASSERSRSAILCPSVDENYTTFRDDWLVLLLTDISEREREERGFCLASSLARSPLQLRVSCGWTGGPVSGAADFSCISLTQGG